MWQVGSTIEDVDEEGLSKEMPLNHGPEGKQGSSHGQSWVEVILEKGKSRSQGRRRKGLAPIASVPGE